MTLNLIRFDYFADGHTKSKCLAAVGDGVN